ncbi:MAG TPA: HEAT repeat domain-containing protein [Planctomycetota bacterium]|nr:HEAT repeat domain-containing protein [Planctomycetota bacterium]
MFETGALWIGLVLSGSLASPQEDRTEVRFQRVHLKNGNFLDGLIVQQTSREVVLKMKFGEMRIAADQIERIEAIKLRSVGEKAEELTPPRRPSPPPKDDPAGRRDPFARPPASRPPTPPPGPPRTAGPRTPDSLFSPRPETREQVDPLLRQLERSDPEQRDPIVQRLVELGGETAPYLASLMEKVDREILVYVVNALESLRDPRSVPVLYRQLESPSALVRQNAIHLVTSIAGAEAAPRLTLLLRDPDPSVRAAAVSGLQTIGDRDAFDALAPLAADPDREVRTRALGALADLARRHDMGDLLSTTLETAAERAQGAALLDVLASLGHTGQPRVWTTLVRYLDHDDADVRAAAVTALGTLGGRDSGPALVARLPVEQDRAVRVALAQAVQKLVLRDATETLIEWLEDSDVEVRVSSLRALRTITGQNLGADPAPWRTWWEENKPKR